MGRAAAVTDSLSKGRNHLKAANRQAEETVKIGVDALQELRRQREMICRMKDNTHDLGRNVNDAEKAVKELEKPPWAVMWSMLFSTNWRYTQTGMALADMMMGDVPTEHDVQWTRG